MTKLHIEIEEELRTEFSNYIHTEDYDFIFENDKAALLAAAGFAVEDKVKVCTTEIIKEKENGTQK